LENHLTNKKVWASYWAHKNHPAKTIQGNIIFSDLFSQIIKSQNPQSFIEIGGFPGTFSVYVKKYFNLRVVEFIDFVVNEEVTKKLLQNNNLDEGSIGVIKDDLFKFVPQKKYDLVFSNGFIEHFNDTKEVIAKHKEFLSESGTALITLPNFKGFNGWLQKTFDPENFKIHNIDCMDIQFLEQIVKELGFKEFDVFYYGVFSIWLENFSEKNIFFKAVFKAVWFIGKTISKILRFRTKYFSPYICIIAKNGS
jgi:SAM-dependent methyltransferase